MIDPDEFDRTDPTHEQYVRRALELAREAVERGDNPFGSLLVRDGEILHEARNSTQTDDDVAAHPELKLARWAARELGSDARRETVMYTSTAPCAMCAGGIYIAGLGGVVYSVTGATAADAAGVERSLPDVDVLARGDDPVPLVGPVLPEEGEALHRERS
jgi:tRNA(Arg) A34 adenosine deaminase TadA